ncbi:MAG: hypothetical protein LBI60_05305 [Bacteroidales bacterium]|jgi:hypothetical protein|nr:hypothetical protein [Bacteroidales bacterium]
MELDEFIKETLVKILKGVKEAQSAAGEYDAYINPVTGSGATMVKIHDRLCNIQNVEFEIALTGTEGSEGTTGIGVWFGGIGMGAKGKEEAENKSATGVKFSIPVSLPYMDNENSPLKSPQSGIIGDGMTQF